jgi:hypothetical protein
MNENREIASTPSSLSEGRPEGKSGATDLYVLKNSTAPLYR